MTEKVYVYFIVYCYPHRFGIRFGNCEHCLSKELERLEQIERIEKYLNNGAVGKENVTVVSNQFLRIEKWGE